MALALPFNFKPIQTLQFNGDSISYTVPADTWAFVTVTIDANAGYGTIDDDVPGATTDVVWVAADNASKSISANFWLNAGDACTSSVPADTNSDTAISASFDFAVDYLATFSVNATVCAQARARVVIKNAFGSGSINLRTYSHGAFAMNVTEYSV